MKLGLTIFLTDQVIDPVTLAKEAEARGFGSLYFPEHTHIPVARKTPHPAEGRDFSASYGRTLDPYIACAAAASVTDRLLLGTGVSLVMQHDPVVLAKEIATLDLISGGRFVLGIGYGWNKDEMETHGIDPATRRALTREYMLAMTALWSQDEASFAGRFVDLPPSWAWPKPAGRTRPRTLIGGAAGPKLFDHIAEFADGWAPFGGSGIREALPNLHRAFDDAGRDRAGLHIVPFNTVPTPGKLEYYESLGISEVVAGLPEGGRDEILAELDRLVKEFPDYLG